MGVLQHGLLERPRPAVTPPADSVPVEIVQGDELELIGYRIDALPTGSQALQLTCVGAACGRLRRIRRQFSTSHPAPTMPSLWGSLTMQSPTMSIHRRCGLPARLCRNMCRLALQNCKRAATQCGWECTRR